MERTLPQLGEVFWALSDKNRAQILTMLRDKEMCACKILEHFDMRQPTLSHHMKVLCDAQLVTCRRESRWAFYQLNQPVIQELMDALGALQQEKGPALPPPAPQGKPGSMCSPVFWARAKPPCSFGCSPPSQAAGWGSSRMSSANWASTARSSSGGMWKWWSSTGDPSSAPA